MNYAKNTQPLASIEYLSGEDAMRMMKEGSETGRTQRPSSHNRVAEYHEKMIQGRWLLTPTHCIGIAPDGFIVDGMHRLKALARFHVGDSKVFTAKPPIKIGFWVCRGVDPETFGVIDRGLNRSDYQIAQMSGSELSQAEWSAIRMATQTYEEIKSTGLPKITSSEDILAVEKYFKSAVELSYPNIRGGSLFKTQGVRGAFIRAFKSREQNLIDTEKLNIFLNAFLTGEIDQHPSLMIPSVLTGRINEQIYAKVRGYGMYKMTLKALGCYLSGSTLRTKNAFEKHKGPNPDFFSIELDLFPKNGSITYSDFLAKS